MLLLAGWLLDRVFRFSPEGTAGEAWPGWEGSERKQAVLSVAFRYLDTYRELLQEEGERSNSFPKVHTDTLTHTHMHTHTHESTSLVPGQALCLCSLPVSL